MRGSSLATHSRLAKSAETGKPKNETLEAFIAYIIKQIGSTEYRQYIATVDGCISDVLQDGQLSCAYFVSNVLLVFRLIKSGHCTVVSTLADMLSCDWRKTGRLLPGAVIVWEKRKQASGISTLHIGLLITPIVAISHVDFYGTVMPHDVHYRFGRDVPPRKIEAIYRHPMLKP